ncbi:MAG: acyl carrier protein [Magnetococcales bacterium]|nr:acyl carrier protein [Magnetococcales bacterium]
MDISQKLVFIFMEALELPAGTDPRSVRKVNHKGWDSLAHATLIMAIENEFDISLDIKDYDRITSFESAFLLITEKCA